MEENVLEDNFDDRFISVFDRLIEIALVIQSSKSSFGVLKDELFNQLLVLVQELRLNLSREEFLHTCEKLKYRCIIKRQFQPIQFCDAEIEMSSNAEGPWFYYKNDNQNNA